MHRKSQKGRAKVLEEVSVERFATCSNQHTSAQSSRFNSGDCITHQLRFLLSPLPSAPGSVPERLASFNCSYCAV